MNSGLLKQQGHGAAKMEVANGLSGGRGRLVWLLIGFP